MIGRVTLLLYSVYNLLRGFDCKKEVRVICTSKVHNLQNYLASIAIIGLIACY